MRTWIAMGVALSACGTSETPHEPIPQPAVEAPAESDTRQLPDDRGELEPEQETEPAPSEPAPEATAPATPLPHASTITGYVRVMSVPRERGATAAVIDDVAVSPEPRAQGMSRWDLTLRPGGPARILVPDTLPSPFRAGQRVEVDASWQGGGPNGRGALVITDDRGLVFAAQQAPPDWTVEPGQRARTDRSGGEVEHRSQVVFTRAGQHVTTLEPGAWTSAPLDGTPYYFWGTAVSRVRGNPNAPVPPDYVAGWLDFAIVRTP